MTCAADGCAPAGTESTHRDLTFMADEKPQPSWPIEPAILVLLGLVFIPVFVIHAIALALEGGG